MNSSSASAWLARALAVPPDHRDKARRARHFLHCRRRRRRCRTIKRAIDVYYLRNARLAHSLALTFLACVFATSHTHTSFAFSSHLMSAIVVVVDLLKQHDTGAK